MPEEKLMSELIASIGGRPPGRPRSEASRKAALRAAIELLDELGYANLTIEGIAARAGIGKRTIYRWWPSKGAVVLEAFLTEITPQIEFRATGSALEDIKNQMRSTLRAYRGRAGRIVRELIAIGQADTDMLIAFRNAYIEPRRQMAKEVLKRAIATGEVRPNLDLDDFVDAMYAPFIYRLLVYRELKAESSIERYTDLLINGLLTKSRRRGGSSRS